MDFLNESIKSNSVVFNELKNMQYDHCTLTRRLRDMNDLCGKPSSNKNVEFKYVSEKPKVVMQNSTDDADSYPKAIYAKVNRKIEMMQNTVDMLVSEKELLVHSNRNMSKEMSTFKSKLSKAERKRSNWVQKRDLNMVKIYIKNFKICSEKGLNDLRSRIRDIEARLESNAKKDQDKDKDTRKLIRHYDELKMGLYMIERDVTKYSIQTNQNMMIMLNMYLREGVNVPMSNGHYMGNDQQALYSPALASQGAPSADPPVLFTRPPAPREAPPAQSETQYPRYSINSDILGAMLKKLRKAGSDNIRKIPMRADMKIPIKVKKTTDETADSLPQPASLEPPVQSIEPTVSQASPVALSPVVISDAVDSTSIII